jgi:hypothetical protein
MQSSAINFRLTVVWVAGRFAITTSGNYAVGFRFAQATAIATAIATENPF